MNCSFSRIIKINAFHCVLLLFMNYDGCQITSCRLLASGLDGAIYIWDKRLSNFPCLELTTNSHSQLNSIALDLEDRVCNNKFSLVFL